MRQLSPTSKSMPLGIVGSNTFGRYPKISLEQTFNMIISDNWLVPFAGYKNILTLLESGQGRGIFASSRLGRIIAVVSDQVFLINTSLNFQNRYTASASFIGKLETESGDVFIAENNADQIAICDKSNIYIYDYSNSQSKFTKVDLNFTPGYVEFQDTYFISVDSETNLWRLSANNEGHSWPDDSSHVGPLQTKPDRLIATVRFPGKGNLLFVFGKTVVEAWYDIGAQLFPYQRSNFSNIDFGCINAATIAANDEVVVWLAQNEKSGSVIVYSNGGEVQKISNDGIDFQLANLNSPDQSYASLFKQDGHLIYLITFYNPADNFTLIYDFNTQKFFTLTDDKRNCHISKKIVFFNNAYFFVAHNDGKFYQISSNFYDGDGKDLPRIRVNKNFRLPDNNRFVINNINLTLEQGQSRNLQEIHMSVSKDGGESFSNIITRELNPLGVRPNRVNYFNLGAANDFIVQFQFLGKGRFVVGEGTMSYYQ